VFDTLCYKEPCIYLTVLVVEFIGSCYPLVFLAVEIGVLLVGISFQAHPILFRHDGVVDRAICTGDFHEAGDNLIRLTGKCGHIVYYFLSVLFTILETVAFVDDDRIVGVAYLSGIFAEHQLSVAGNGKIADFFPYIAALVVRSYLYRTGDEVTESLCSRGKG